MGNSSQDTSWMKKDTPRQAALSFFNRYWGLETMQRERGLMQVPLLPDGEDEEEDGVGDG